MFLGKKPTDADKPVVNPSDNNKPADKPNTDKPVDKPNVDKPIDKPVVDNNKPADKVDVNKPVTGDKDSKVDTNKPVSNNTDNKVDASKIKVERPAVANRNSGVPKTSDSSNIALYSALFAGTVIITSVVLKRRFKTNK